MSGTLTRLSLRKGLGDTLQTLPDGVYGPVFADGETGMNTRSRPADCGLSAQDLAHRLALGQFVDQLVQVAISASALGDLLDAHAADHALISVLPAD